MTLVKKNKWNKKLFHQRKKENFYFCFFSLGITAGIAGSVATTKIFAKTAEIKKHKSIIKEKNMIE